MKVLYSIELAAIEDDSLPLGSWNIGGMMTSLSSATPLSPSEGLDLDEYENQPGVLIQCPENTHRLHHVALH